MVAVYNYPVGRQIGNYSIEAIKNASQAFSDEESTLNTGTDGKSAGSV